MDERVARYLDRNENKYWGKYRGKVMDNNDTSSLVTPNTLTGLLASNDDGQWNLRAQIQLMF